VDKRLNQIQEFLIQLASGNFKHQVTPSESLDEIDAIMVGINMLAEELKVSQDKHVALFEYSGDAILIYRAATSMFVDSNEMATLLLGYSKEDIRQLSIIDLFPKEEKTRIKSKVTYLKSVLQTNFDAQIETNTGKLKYVSFLSKKVPYGEGQYFQISLRDITESKNISNNLIKKNAALKIAQNQLNQLNDNLENKVNERTKELSENKIKLEKSLAKERLRRAALLDSEKKLKESLLKEQELGQLKTSFVSTASHQFRTPLAVIQSNADLLEMFANSTKKIEPKKHKQITDRIKEEITKMTALMDDVLTLGKSTSGNVHYNPQELDVLGFCKTLANQFNDIATDGRSINVIAEGEPYTIHLDVKLLNHALSNLISNALKYSLGKKSPELAIRFKTKELILSVKDYGIGIPKKEQLNLFHPFFRADNVTAIAGTGLGLSIAKEYIEINKGQITAKSVLGEGSCIDIIFKR
jgi:PAS domain S-box-containing protein